MSDSIARIARTAAALRVPMSHVARDEEYPAVLAYRIAQERAAAVRRIASLDDLASQLAALQAPADDRSPVGYQEWRADRGLAPIVGL